jgi:hypothetical protein
MSEAHVEPASDSEPEPRAGIAGFLRAVVPYFVPYKVTG